MPYQINDGYVCDMDGEACLARYDFGDVEFRAAFFSFMEKLINFGDFLTSTVEETEGETENEDAINDIARHAKTELEAAYLVFSDADALLGDGFCARHVGNKNPYRLLRAIVEISEHGKRAIEQQVDTVDQMASEAVNRAQRRAAKRKQK